MKKDTSILRSAVMKKNTPYKFKKRLSKGDEVMIQKTPVGRGKFVYSAFNPNDKEIGGVFNVTPSMFEYTDNETFVVFTKRTITSYRNIEVQAKDEKEAQRLALEIAPTLEFDEPETDHGTHGILTKEETKKMFQK